jgi:hypothetical protein
LAVGHPPKSLDWDLIDLDREPLQKIWPIVRMKFVRMNFVRITYLLSEFNHVRMKTVNGLP